MNKTSQQDITDPIAMGDEVFSMDLEAFLLQVYQEQGYESTLAFTKDFLLKWEDCNVGPENPLYEIDGINRTREEYAVYMADNISAMAREIGNEVNLDQTDNWEELDDQDFLAKLESLLQNQFSQYTGIIREIERLKDQKEALSDLFSSNVSAWAHYKFKKPAATPDSVALYMAAKQTVLRSIVPGYSLYRNLTMKVKQMDPWTIIEDDSSRGVGICDENGNRVVQIPSDASRFGDLSQQNDLSR
ncbi:hypothetical protein G6F21_013611 [Rhizopus arrhizus]|nr:hypothetical protein G6F21_013611 [Rhizopus arrhizus]KAG0936739.1 hypothetical protein G6F31_015698 [Rhizopus arrhizus]KAG1073698.1 hypothetical protein G6F42_025785 [Rhizopus arrhizus]KAG1390446.1 hypothetical protein G6F60_012979 [Rhizopus arrhizus]